jgi:hypothetical protein
MFGLKIHLAAHDVRSNRDCRRIHASEASSRQSGIGR